MVKRETSDLGRRIKRQVQRNPPPPCSLGIFLAAEVGVEDAIPVITPF